MLKKLTAYLTAVLMLSLFLLTGCKKSQGTITVGAKNFTEQYIVSEMMAKLLKKNGFKVKKQFGTGSSITRDGLITGQTDLYAEYTGTAWTVYLKHDEIITEPEVLYNKVKQEDLQKNKIVWLDRFALNNTYALAIKKSGIKKYGQSISSLGTYIKQHPGQVLAGIDHEFFERPDGFLALLESYAFKIPKKNIKFMEIGLSYGALDQGDVDVAMVYTTDGLLKKFDLKVLEDDNHFFPVYNLCITVRQEILNSYPQIKEILRPLSGLLDDVTMQELNFRVDARGLPADVVAKQFLTEHNLLD